MEIIQISVLARKPRNFKYFKRVPIWNIINAKYFEFGMYVYIGFEIFEKKKNKKQNLNRTTIKLNI